jgi:putative hydrolase of the HAD superfamily
MAADEARRSGYEYTHARRLPDLGAVCYRRSSLLPANLGAILFDAGGTLVRIDYAYIAETASTFGYAISESDLHSGEAVARRAIDARAGSLRGHGDTDARRIPGYFESLLRAAGLRAEGLEQVLRAVEAKHRESNLWCVPLEGARATLLDLRERGVRTAIVSNSDGRVRELLRRLELVDLVEFVIDSHEEGVEKPDPEIFRRALGRLGLPAERVAYIGDIYSIDAVGARAAGLHPVLVDPTGSYADVDCHTVTSLPELLRGLDGAGGGASGRRGKG